MKKTIFYILFVFTFFAASCERDIIVPGGNEPAHPEGTVPVYINMEVGDVSFVGEEPLTKAATDAEKKIQDFWVLQFNGALSSSTLVAAQLISYNSENLDENVLFLYPSEGATHRIVILTNQPTGTNNLFTTGMTYDNLLSRSYSTETMRAYISNNGGIIPMSGYTDAVITAKMTLSCTVTRNVAKVTFNLSKTTSDYSLDSLFICNVPSQSYLYPHGRTGVFPAADADRININLGSLASISSTATEFTFYIPVNQAGTSASSTSSILRRAYAPIPATFLTVRGQKTLHGAPALIYYHKYIGTNETTNFNVLPNNTYTYTYRITGSNIGTNTNIEKSEINNCYVVESSDNRTFTIDVAEMVNRFWKKESQKVHPNDTDITLETLWSEGISDDGETATTLSALNFSRITGTTKFTITMPSNVEGNYLVAIKKDNITRWSYHIWCSSGSSNVYSTRTLPSGKKIMRRNLGSIWQPTSIFGWGSVTHGSLALGYWRGQTLGLTYQWGRKDPFRTFSNPSQIVNGVKKTDYSIENPEIFITGSEDWCENSDQYAWCDSQGRKTIYDPCPKGWKVSESSTWDNVSDVSSNSISLFLFPSGRAIKILYSDESYSSSNYLPIPGYRTGNNGTLSDRDNYYYGGYPSGIGIYWNNTQISNSVGNFLYVDRYNISTSVSGKSYSKSTGASIRCQKIE